MKYDFDFGVILENDKDINLLLLIYFLAVFRLWW